MGDYRPIDPREPQAQQQAQWQAPQQQPWTGQQPQWQQPPYPGPGQQSQWQKPPPPWTGQQPQWQKPPPYPGPIMEKEKSWITRVFLCRFVGTVGIHPFYTGGIVTGIFQ